MKKKEIFQLYQTNNFVELNENLKRLQFPKISQNGTHSVNAYNLRIAHPRALCHDMKIELKKL